MLDRMDWPYAKDNSVIVIVLSSFSQTISWSQIVLEEININAVRRETWPSMNF